MIPSVSLRTSSVLSRQKQEKKDSVSPPVERSPTSYCFQCCIPVKHDVTEHF